MTRGHLEYGMHLCCRRCRAVSAHCALQTWWKVDSGVGSGVWRGNGLNCQWLSGSVRGLKGGHSRKHFNYFSEEKRQCKVVDSYIRVVFISSIFQGIKRKHAKAGFCPSPSKFPSENMCGCASRLPTITTSSAVTVRSFTATGPVYFLRLRIFLNCFQSPLCRLDLEKQTRAISPL